MLNPIVQAARLCSTITVKTADWAPPTKLIHVVKESCAGYLFNVYAYNSQDKMNYYILQIVSFWLIKPHIIM